jgi:hypothetical protein
MLCVNEERSAFSRVGHPTACTVAGTHGPVFLPMGIQPSQAKVLTGGGDLREAQVDVPLSVSHTCV